MELVTPSDVFIFGESLVVSTPPSQPKGVYENVKTTKEKMK